MQPQYRYWDRDNLPVGLILLCAARRGNLDTDTKTHVRLRLGFILFVCFASLAVPLHSPGVRCVLMTWNTTRRRASPVLQPRCGFVSCSVQKPSYLSHVLLPALDHTCEAQGLCFIASC
jgi:hypothetical protein